MGLCSNHRRLSKIPATSSFLHSCMCKNSQNQNTALERNYILYLENKYLKALSGAIIKDVGDIIQHTHTSPICLFYPDDIWNSSDTTTTAWFTRISRYGAKEANKTKQQSRFSCRRNLSGKETSTLKKASRGKKLLNLTGRSKKYSLILW